MRTLYIVLGLLVFLTGCATTPEPPPVLPASQPGVELKDTNIGLMVRFTVNGQLLDRSSETYTHYSPQDAISRVGESMLERGYRVKALDNYPIFDPKSGNKVPFYIWPGDIGEARQRFLEELERGGFQDGGVDTVVLGEIDVHPGSFDQQAGVHTAQAKTNLEVINVYTHGTYPTYQRVSGQGLDPIVANTTAMSRVLDNAVETITGHLDKLPPRHEYLLSLLNYGTSIHTVYPMRKALEGRNVQVVRVDASNPTKASLSLRYDDGSIALEDVVQGIVADQFRARVRDVKLDGHRITIEFQPKDGF